MKVFSGFSLFLLIIATSLACTEIIDIELPQHDEKIIVNSFFTAGKPLKVHLSKSMAVLEDTISLCDNAFVRLLEENEVIEHSQQRL